LAAFTVTITPRFYETDALGHINNASIAAWLEVVRMGFIASLSGSGSQQEPDRADNWILASLQIDFVAETFFGDDVIGCVTAAEAGNSSLTVHCELSQGGRLTVKARAVVVFMDPQTRRPARLPDAYRGQLD
jgi:acyl-CoA thioester hydrolase